MDNKAIIERGAKTIMPTYARFPVALVKGQGMRVWDGDGVQYLDFLSGIAVCNLGHCHPTVTEAIMRQAATLVHVSNLYHIEPQVELAELLVANTFADKVFFANSGAEANEGAIKLARKVAFDKGETNRRKVVTCSQSFHGRTLATLTATGQEKVKVGFAPLPDGFETVPFDDLAALDKAVDGTVAAVLMEVVQGEGGVRVPSPGYVKSVRELCEKRGALLIFDEVQTGVGRTGTFLACEAEGVNPDVATLAKGLGNGVPIGAVLTTDVYASHFGPGTHATTFGGNPLCAAAGAATVRTILEGELCGQALATGDYFMNKLRTLCEATGAATEVRGRGLLIGMELASGNKAADVVAGLLDKGFLIGSAGESVVRFAPPLIVEKKEIDALMVALEEVLAP